MRSIFKLLVIFPLLVACSKEEETPVNPLPDDDGEKYSLKVTPSKARIGDTITIEGTNLNRMAFKFNGMLASLPTTVIPGYKVKVVVPTVYNEKVKITMFDYATPSNVIDSVDLSIYGFIPLSIPQFAHKDITHVEAISESIFYTVCDGRVYKTLDGGYAWTEMAINTRVNAIQFMDEKHGWVIASNKLYSTVDGAKTFTLVYSFPDLTYEHLADVKFTSPNTGYLLTTKGSIYSNINSTTFKEIYRYPYSNRQSGFSEFFTLSASGTTLMSYGGESYLITGRNGTFTLQPFQEHVGKIQLFNEDEVLITRGGDLHYSADAGQSWNKISDNKKIRDFEFLTKKIGISVTYTDNGNYPFYLQETKDGGKTWYNKTELRNLGVTHDIALYGNVGIISGYRGQMWKYIRQ